MWCGVDVEWCGVVWCVVVWCGVVWCGDVVWSGVCVLCVCGAVCGKKETSTIKRTFNVQVREIRLVDSIFSICVYLLK